MEREELDDLAMYVHGALAGLHVLGVLYNAKRRNWFGVLVHSAVLVFDTKSAVEHSKGKQPKGD